MRLLVNMFSCKACDKVFTRKQNMLKHAKMRHNVKLVDYQCSKCPKSYKRQCNLTVHVKSKHGRRNAAVADVPLKRKSGVKTKVQKVVNESSAPNVERQNNKKDILEKYANKEFFYSLLPLIKDFNNVQTLAFRGQVISSIQRITDGAHMQNNSNNNSNSSNSNNRNSNNSNNSNSNNSNNSNSNNSYSKKSNSNSNNIFNVMEARNLQRPQQAHVYHLKQMRQVQTSYHSQMVRGIPHPLIKP